MVRAALTLQQQIDEALDAAFAEWRGVHGDATEWNEWDEDSKLLYKLEWGLAEDRLGRLRAWAASGAMIAEQRARYEELLQLVEQTRPLLKQLGIR